MTTHHRPQVPKLLAAAASAALAAIAASHANAGLVMDIRAVGGSSGIIISPDGKQVFVTGPGDTVNLAIFAQVSGTDGDNTNERLTSGMGSIVSGGIAPATSDRLLGNLSGAFVPPYDSLTFDAGSRQDIDSDGDIDIGSTGSASIGKIQFRSATNNGQGEPLTTHIGPNASEALVYQASFSVTSTQGGTQINWITRRRDDGTPINAAALWWEDGETITHHDAGNGSYTAGPPVVVAIPEPTPLAALALPALGLLARRRQ